MEQQGEKRLCSKPPTQKWETIYLDFFLWKRSEQKKKKNGEVCGVLELLEKLGCFCPNAFFHVYSKIVTKPVYEMLVAKQLLFSTKFLNEETIWKVFKFLKKNKVSGVYMTCKVALIVTSSLCLAN